MWASQLSLGLGLLICQISELSEFSKLWDLSDTEFPTSSVSFWYACPRVGCREEMESLIWYLQVQSGVLGEPLLMMNNLLLEHGTRKKRNKELGYSSDPFVATPDQSGSTFTKLWVIVQLPRTLRSYNLNMLKWSKCETTGESNCLGEELALKLRNGYHMAGSRIQSDLASHHGKIQSDHDSQHHLIVLSNQITPDCLMLIKPDPSSSLGKHCFGSYSWCSSYLLQGIKFACETLLGCYHWAVTRQVILGLSLPPLCGLTPSAVQWMKCQGLSLDRVSSGPSCMFGLNTFSHLALSVLGL